MSSWLINVRERLPCTLEGTASLVSTPSGLLKV